MIFLLLLSFSGIQFSLIDIWSLRAGSYTGEIPSAASLYFSAAAGSEDQMPGDQLITEVSMGDRSMLIPLASRLVASGDTDLAVIYWNTTGINLPVTRNELLNALAWYARFDLYPVMATRPPVPSDMEETMYSAQCAAICSIGWMRVRNDGYFHADDVVSPGDIQILSRYLEGFSSSMEYLPVSYIDSVFHSDAGILQ
jgi:hypothetical protein